VGSAGGSCRRGARRGKGKEEVREEAQEGRQVSISPEIFDLFMDLTEYGSQKPLVATNGNTTAATKAVTNAVTDAVTTIKCEASIISIRHAFLPRHSHLPSSRAKIIIEADFCCYRCQPTYTIK